MIQNNSLPKYIFSGKLAIFCSDERFIKAVMEFLNKNLNIKLCDLMVVPGGPEFVINKKNILHDRLKLLVNAHKISNIILFSHADCKFYKNKYKLLNSKMLYKQQIKDINKCRQQINKMFPRIIVKSFYISYNKNLRVPSS